nr:hypothetical protein BDOA9_0203740 [Bradyrhizobium sp. DOA9]
MSSVADGEAGLHFAAETNVLRALTLGEWLRPLKLDRDTPSASHSHATGQIVRRLAMKTNFMSLLREDGCGLPKKQPMPGSTCRTKPSDLARRLRLATTRPRYCSS